MIIFDEHGNETPAYQAYKRTLQGKIEILAESMMNFVYDNGGDENDYRVLKGIAFQMLVAVDKPNEPIGDKKS